MHGCEKCPSLKSHEIAAENDPRRVLPVYSLCSLSCMIWYASPWTFRFLKYDISLIGDEQDPVIRYRFFTIGCPDVHGIWLQADAGASHAGPVAGSATVDIPDLDFADVVAVVVPVLLQEFVAGQHNSSPAGSAECRS